MGGWVGRSVQAVRAESTARDGGRKSSRKREWVDPMPPGCLEWGDPGGSLYRQEIKGLWSVAQEKAARWLGT